MNFLLQFFHTILYRPLLNLLILFYAYLPGQDFGLAVILLTLLIKVVLLPSSKKSVKSQQAMAKLQPKIKEAQEKFKGDRQQQSIALMELYKKEKVSPVSGCLPLLLQLPILIALYQVFLNVFKPEVIKDALYGFVTMPAKINPNFLGLVDLSRPFTEKIDEKTIYYWPVLLLALLTGLAQFWQMKQTMPSLKKSEQKNKKKDGAPDFSHIMQKQMLYVFPALLLFIILKFGSIIGLYILVSSLFSIGEHYFINRKAKPAEVEK